MEENTFRRGSRYFQSDTARKMRENIYLLQERDSYFSLNRDSIGCKGDIRNVDHHSVERYLLRPISLHNLMEWWLSIDTKFYTKFITHIGILFQYELEYYSNINWNIEIFNINVRNVHWSFLEQEFFHMIDKYRKKNLRITIIEAEILIYARSM